LRLQLSQDAEQQFVVWLAVNVVHIHVSDDALLVNDKDGALGMAFRTQDAKSLSDLSVREKIAQEWVCDPAQTVCPCLEARDAVNAETQNLGLHPIEPVECDLVRWNLRRSDRGPGEREKRQHDIALATIVTQSNGLLQMAL
jgi:hypothetical protein